VPDGDPSRPAYSPRPDDHPEIEGGTSLHAFLDDLRERTSRATSPPDDEAVDRPFLTIVVRTQGRRPETVRDTLLCLLAQTAQDFEIVVTVHDAAAAQVADVRHAVGDVPSAARDRMRVLEVEGGGRARPLNEAFAVANGRYVAFLDDDDLVLGHWVESFSTLADCSPGSVLRAVCVEQAVVGEAWDGDRPGVRAVGPVVHRYPAQFDLVEHLAHNRSPFMAYAFPRAVFHQLGLRFDETLDICEDWDFELQAALLVGVASTDAVTCIYRRWTGGESSYTRHTVEEWRRTEGAIIARLDARPHLFPSGTITRLREVAGLPRVLSTHDASGDEDLLATIDRLEATLAEYEASRSWHLTRPLRAASAAAKRMRPG
jgi:glycosyltransferase involved in cell wall biosynthesis